MRDICDARSLPHTCDDAWGGDIIAAACVHVGATVTPSRFEGSWIAAPYIDGHYDEENPVRIEGEFRLDRALVSFLTWRSLAHQSRLLADAKLSGAIFRSCSAISSNQSLKTTAAVDSSRLLLLVR